MDKEFLESLGVDEDLAAKILEQNMLDVEQIKSELENRHSKRICTLKTDLAIDRALTIAGARNLKAARALISIDESKSSEEMFKNLESQIEELVSNKDTSFLFGLKPDNNFIGISPADKCDDKPDVNLMSYSEFMAMQNI